MKKRWYPLGPDANMQEQIVQACRLFAEGMTYAEVAKVMGSSVGTLENWRGWYGDAWRTAYRAAVEAKVPIVRRMAGTDEVLQNPAAYENMATAAEALLQQSGETLFTPSPDDLPRLAEILEKHYLPLRTFNATPGYIDLLRATVRRWAIVTGDPPIDKIDATMLARFRKFLSGRRGLKPGSKAKIVTVANALRRIQWLLDFTGPIAKGNRDGLGILQTVPWLRPPRAEQLVPKIATFEQLSAVYNVAESATLPEIAGINAGDWWRALLVFVYNTGLRRRSIFSVEWKHVDLQGHTVRVPPLNIKSKRELVLPLNSITCEHLAKIRRGDDDKVFPWTNHKRHFDNTLKSLEWRAGVPQDQQFGLHRIRKTLASTLWRDNPAAAQLALGHTNLGITMKHYVQGAGIMRDAINRLSQPTAFTEANGNSKPNGHPAVSERPQVADDAERNSGWSI